MLYTAPPIAPRRVRRAAKSDDEQWAFVGGDWATASGSGGAFTAPLNEANNNLAILASARYTAFDATFDWRFSPDNPCGCLLLVSYRLVLRALLLLADQRGSCRH